MAKIITKRHIQMWANKATLDPALAKKKTRKGAKHIQGKKAQPSVGDIAPSEWRRKKIKQTRKAKAKRIQLRKQQKAQKRRNQ